MAGESTGGENQEMLDVCRRTLVGGGPANKSGGYSHS